MACVLTTSFPLDCKDGIGGIKNIWIVESSAKASITTNASGTVTAMSLTGGKNFFKYELPKETATFEPEVVVNDVNGTVYHTAKLAIQLRKLEIYKRNEIKLLAQNRLLIIVLDRNGVYWLLGNNNGCDLTSAKGTAGQKMGDFNGWNLEFMATEEDAPLILSTGVTTSLGL